jgi:hypothetical protein
MLTGHIHKQERALPWQPSCCIDLTRFSMMDSSVL